MRYQPDFFLPPASPARIELVLVGPDGGEWTLAVSSGMERFIGFYPRVDGIASDGPLLHFRIADPA